MPKITEENLSEIVVGSLLTYTPEDHSIFIEVVTHVDKEDDKWHVEVLYATTCGIWQKGEKDVYKKKNLTSNSSITITEPGDVQFIKEENVKALIK